MDYLDGNWRVLVACFLSQTGATIVLCYNYYKPFGVGCDGHTACEIYVNGCKICSLALDTIQP